MAAVMNDYTLEPNGLGHDLLLEWAPWARDDNDDGARHTWSSEARENRQRGYHGDPPSNFFIVDKIVAPQRKDRTAFWTVTAMYYLGERSPYQIAKILGGDWSERRVLLNICGFGALVEREWRDYTDARRVVITPAR